MNETSWSHTHAHAELHGCSHADKSFESTEVSSGAPVQSARDAEIGAEDADDTGDIPRPLQTMPKSSDLSCNLLVWE